ncbi:hypothetical protein MXC99_01955 [Thauera aromatica]|uniref:hypothetical protein n=1 Tax=Thauera aromatica TaxID=59405 RepID=UPI001FFCF7B6|nr:hypothetical protein [Thauera aromatica]MCK2086953.1 hypothetical protein [Thauera aromatica]
MTHKNIETVKRIDFDRLDMLVSERIGALKLYAQNIDQAEGGKDAHDAICRDLILPCVYALAQFLESVKLDEAQQ